MKKKERKISKSIRVVDQNLVLELVAQRGYFRRPHIESFNTVLIRKLGLNNARKSRKTN